MASVPCGLTTPRASRIASLHRFDQLITVGKNRGPERRETEQFILSGDHCLTDTRRLRLRNTNDGYGQPEKIAGDRTAVNPIRIALVCLVRPLKQRLCREWLRKRHLLRSPSGVFQRQQQERPKTLGIEMDERKIVRDWVACFLQACLCRACHIDEHVFCIGLADVECRRFLMTVPRQAASISRSWRSGPESASYARPVSPSELKSLKRSDFESEP